MKNLCILSTLSLVLLSGCTPLGLATGAGAAVGVASAQEGGISSAATDARIQIEINDLWFRYSVDAFRKLDMTVDQGRVLLTGVVQDPEMRVEAVRLAWQPSGVKQVINEIQVADSSGILGFGRDTWITTRLRTTLVFDKDVQSINYSIDTVQGVVYLMGTAQNQAELNRVIEVARTVPDVKRVVSYVKIAGSRISDTTTQPDASEGASFDDSSDSYGSPPSQSYDNTTSTEGAPLDIRGGAIESEPLQ